MKLFIIVALTVAVSACSNTRSSPPRPAVDYTNETNPYACMIEPDDVKRMTCFAITRKSAAYCAPIKDANQLNFCTAAAARAKVQQ